MFAKVSIWMYDDGGIYSYGTEMLNNTFRPSNIKSSVYIPHPHHDTEISELGRRGFPSTN